MDLESLSSWFRSRDPELQLNILAFGRAAEETRQNIHGASNKHNSIQKHIQTCAIFTSACKRDAVAGKK